MLLGDLGADVIKVERPRNGDDTRGWGPPFDDRGESAYYLSVNRNKLSVALDLTVEADQAVVRQLVAAADVVVDNFLPGVLQRLGLDVDDVLSRHDQLVWCTIGGFPEAPQRPGYDFIVQAESGWMAITGAAGGEPMKSGVALADVIAGEDAAVAILAALVARTRGATSPRRLNVTLAESARAALLNVAQNTLVSGRDAARWGNAHANLVPYQFFRAADRDMVIAVGTDEQWRGCASSLGLEELVHDQTLMTNAGRLAQRERVVKAIAHVLTARSASVWINVLQSRGVPCGIVKTVLEAIADAGSASALTGMPSSVGGAVRFPPPRLDEHGNAIREHGWNAFAE